MKSEKKKRRREREREELLQLLQTRLSTWTVENDQIEVQRPRWEWKLK